MSGELVLVTGGSGFLGAHCILAALEQFSFRSLNCSNHLFLRNSGRKTATQFSRIALVSAEQGGLVRFEELLQRLRLAA
ncbi:MAG: hypothetical protein E5Y01_10945 [Mesorhizobium sp.]|nr:MAG: hypothetical protein EOR74_25595 [Mesorhizobium sp.]RWM40388.1 MAG: hypothetical protein EOR75_09140 [Mesorhizobium sp.]TJV52188.1 MAG: hypothetical protein E5Y01_10945 [Mesorhizobium sp.]